ncbi:hypothetical protein [Aliikangiella coralliicola]|uniref:Uncharacterized protein n=1 Tax=Aliikangiella coralliicola TaxID=2592383 RepID=A0A545UHE7_9GAMM|nr:hypothetical protein [Aliikangiella coralliicola]TQV88885.1 hypothetical protein FLL46_04950 [Aliikangiella coralliicola]
MLELFLVLFLLGALLAGIGAFWYVKRKKIDVWFRSYLKKALKKSNNTDKTIDIMFQFVDHFELNGHADRLDAWQNRYPSIAGKHTDSDGHHPKHTFFYAMDLMHEHELEALAPLVKDGYGEFELHWHHSHDTEESLVRKISDAMDIFHKYEMMKPYREGEKACFGFIHGDWSLANARGENFCGVDNEVALLKSLGCYGDFTFPALFNEAQPPRVNDIYYCTNLDKPKCHFEGRESSVGALERKDEFMVFQGPLTINWSDWRHKWHPTIEDGDINQFPTHNDPKRIKAWIRQGIHVQGRPEWVFVKVFCHGAQDHKSVVSQQTDEMFSYLEKHYNDGKKYRLHYVTSREAYNIVKAAEEGKSGNPNEYRDYQIPHPLNR